MRRSCRLAIATVWLVLGAALAACSAGSAPAPSGASSPPAAGSPSAPSLPVGTPSQAASPSPSASAAPSSPVVGVVIAVEASGPTKVESFTIRTDAGEELTFALGKLRSDAFPPGHLAEHKATAEPVQVSFLVDGDRLVATSLGDAP